MNYAIALCLLIALIFMGTGLLFKNKTLSFKLFLFYNLLLSIILFAFLLNSLQLPPENLLLNFFSLLYYVACIAFPPTLYVYIKTLGIDFGEYEKPDSLLIHFTPAIILLIVNLFSFAYFNTTLQSHAAYMYVENIMTYSNIIALYFVFLIQSIFYSIFSVKEYLLYRKKVNDLYSFEDGVDLKWVRIFIAGFILFVVSIYVIQTIGNTGYWFELAIISYLLLINYSAFKQESMYKKLTKYVVTLNTKLEQVATQSPIPIVDNEHIDIVPKMLDNANDEDDEMATIDNSTTNDTTTNVDNTFNTDSKLFEELSQKVQHSIEVDKVFLDPELSLVKLANLLNTNTKYLSTFINSKFDKNFSNFINEYRVQEAMRLIKSDYVNQYTLEAIAELSGFKSRSVFIAAFKKMTGKTPSQFKKDA